METFEEYLDQARKDFTHVAAKYTVKEHLELRTAIDNLLIAYDQATAKALSDFSVYKDRNHYCKTCGNLLDT